MDGPGDRPRRGRLARAALPLAGLLATACAFGGYGERGGLVSDRVPDFITPGQTHKSEVLAKLGEPDAVAISGPTEVLFYRATGGWAVGIVGRVVRHDLVIRAEGDLVMTAEARRIGDSMGIGLPPFPDRR